MNRRLKEGICWRGQEFALLTDCFVNLCSFSNCSELFCLSPLRPTLSSIAQRQASFSEHLTYITLLFLKLVWLDLIRVNRKRDLKECLFPRKGGPCGCPTHILSAFPGGHLLVVPTHSDGFLWLCLRPLSSCRTELGHAPYALWSGAGQLCPELTLGRISGVLHPFPQNVIEGGSPITLKVDSLTIY